MEKTFELVMPHVFVSEGGLSNRKLKDDPGGLTNFGITHKTLRGAFAQGLVNHSDPYKLTKDEATKIYKVQYWDAIKGDQLPYGIDYAVFDFAINSGSARAVKELQRVLGVQVDGIIGLVTLSEINRIKPSELIHRYSARRLAFMESLRNWNANKNGWTKRVEHVTSTSLDLIDGNLDGIVSEPEKAPIASGKADGKVKTSSIVCKPEAIGAAASFITGVLGSINDNEILSYGALFCMVVAGSMFAYYYYKRMQQQEVV
jgi:lysozyme family protein